MNIGEASFFHGEGRRFFMVTVSGSVIHGILSGSVCTGFVAGSVGSFCCYGAVLSGIHIRERIASSRIRPIPRTRISSSTEPNGPESSRDRMIASASAGPIPGSVRSSVDVARFRLIRHRIGSMADVGARIGSAGRLTDSANGSVSPRSAAHGVMLRSSHVPVRNCRTANKVTMPMRKRIRIVRCSLRGNCGPVRGGSVSERNDMTAFPGGVISGGTGII